MGELRINNGLRVLLSNSGDQYPEALAAETIEATLRSPASSMTADEERAVLRWLDHIGETDPATIAEVLTACRRDEEARRYFVARPPRSSVTKDGGADQGHTRTA